MVSAGLHRHHIIPRHAGGKDIARNLTLLSIEDHAEAHRKRWLAFGQWQDKIAWKMLSGAIDRYEANRLASSIANSRPKGPHSEETKRKMSLAHVGRVYPPSKKRGIPLDPETKRKISLANKGKSSWVGRKHTPETKLKMAASKKALIDSGWKPWHGQHSAETKLKMSLAAKNRKKRVSGAPTASPSTSEPNRRAVGEVAILSLGA